MATKKSKVMNPAPGPKPGPRKAGKHHPAQHAPVGHGQTMDGGTGKGGTADTEMRARGGGPRPMLAPVSPGKNQMNVNPR